MDYWHSTLPCNCPLFLTSPAKDTFGACAVALMSHSDLAVLVAAPTHNAAGTRGLLGEHEVQ